MTTDTTVPTNLGDICGHWGFETSEAKGVLALTLSAREGDVNNAVFSSVREAGLEEFVDALIEAAETLKAAGEGMCANVLAFEQELMKGRPILANGVLVPKREVERC